MKMFNRCDLCNAEIRSQYSSIVRVLEDGREYVITYAGILRAVNDQPCFARQDICEECLIKLVNLEQEKEQKTELDSYTPNCNLAGG